MADASRPAADSLDEAAALWIAHLPKLPVLTGHKNSRNRI
jgi:hypothetical protein